MKLSQKTLTILKNFASINTNMLIRQGNVLSTITEGTTIFARATIEETFPRQFGVYDLNSLLALLTFADDQEIEFGDSSLKITKDSGEFEYFYANEDIIKVAPDKTIPVKEYYSFKLSKSDLDMMVKAAGIVSASTFSVVAKKGKVNIVIGDPGMSTANSYKKLIGESDLEFNAMIQIDNLKLISDSYDVTINPKFFYFKSATTDLQYWLAVNPKSVIS